MKIGDSIIDSKKLVIQSYLGKIKIEPKIMEALKVLIENPGEMITRENLIDQV